MKWTDFQIGGKNSQMFNVLCSKMSLIGTSFFFFFLLRMLENVSRVSQGLKRKIQPSFSLSLNSLNRVNKPTAAESEKR